ncbi:metalloendoproteinase 1-like [Gastrolobium bilobum]|uniref:metalloendoproteinase 1-like n=1 Tax=Gastrolobium bilobum TaxID=150636 RepID=UPI002AB0F268|nr:metalloendoproteinase 1-like [Gastrolobium bilobum]
MDVVRQACESAFKSWSQVTDFTFSKTEGEDDTSDIVIWFNGGNHGYGYPFDGPRIMLAHMFPLEDGRLHYDTDEEWTTNPIGGFPLVEGGGPLPEGEGHQQHGYFTEVGSAHACKRWE